MVRFLYGGRPPDVCVNYVIVSIVTDKNKALEKSTPF